MLCQNVNSLSILFNDTVLTAAVEWPCDDGVQHHTRKEVPSDDLRDNRTKDQERYYTVTVAIWWHTVTHGRGSEGETGERSG